MAPHRNAQATGEQSSLEAVEEAISQARAAAQAAGFDVDKASRTSTDSSGNIRGSLGLTSFAFRLDNLDTAAKATALEHDLNTIPGVDAVVVYSSHMAWISAQEHVHPGELLEHMRSHGVHGWMTASTLRRRSARLDMQESWHRMRRHSTQAKKSRRTARRSTARLRSAMGFSGSGLLPLRNRHPFDGTEVLHTARELITQARLIVALVLGVPVVAMETMQAWQFEYWQWVALALATPVVSWCAWPFHRAMAGGLRRGLSALDGASSSAIVIAYGYSLWLLLFTPAGQPGWHTQQVFVARGWMSPQAQGSLFLDVACGVTILLLFGRLVSRRNQLRSRALVTVPQGALEAEVTVVRKTRHGKVTKSQVHPKELRRGDDIIIPFGAWVPSDCEVVSGKSEVDMGFVGSVVRRRDVAVGDRVFAGARNVGQPVKLRVQQTGSHTRLAGMQRWLRNAALDENRFTQLANKSASLLVPWALGIATVNFMGWVIIHGSVDAAMSTSLSVLVSVAPVALALSAPLALRLGLGHAAAQGVLLKEAGTIHQLAQVDSVVFNRLGTLTTGPMRVLSITPAKGENPDLVLRVAAALCVESDHAVSRAIVRADREARDANAGGDAIPHWLDSGEVRVSDDGTFHGVVEIPWAGQLRHVQASLWRPRDLGELKDHRLAAAAVSGGTPVIVRWKDKDRGVITLNDSLRDDATQAVDLLEEMDIETFMLSRDTYPVARRFANSVGISTVLAGIAPARKEATVRSLHARGHHVAMVGDKGMGAALRAADVGIVMNGEHNVAGVSVSSADVVIAREDVSAIPEIINYSRHVRKTVDWNIWLSWMYNGGAMILAMSGWLNPLIAPVAMLASSALIEWRSERVVHRRFSDSVLRHTHTWQGWTQRLRTLRALKKREELRAAAHVQAREEYFEDAGEQPLYPAAR